MGIQFPTRWCLKDPGYPEEERIIEFTDSKSDGNTNDETDEDDDHNDDDDDDDDDDEDEEDDSERNDSPDINDF